MELRRVIKYRNECLEADGIETTSANRDVIAVGLTTRRNLCLIPEVANANTREESDSLCRQLTASWVKINQREKQTNLKNPHQTKRRYNARGKTTLWREFLWNKNRLSCIANVCV